jgi:hypothetical protein
MRTGNYVNFISKQNDSTSAASETADEIVMLSAVHSAHTPVHSLHCFRTTVNFLKPEVRQWNITNPTSNLTENTLRLLNTSLLKPFRGIIGVYCENRRNTQIHCVGRMQSFSVIKQVVCIVTTGR